MSEGFGGLLCSGWVQTGAMAFVHVAFDLLLAGFAMELVTKEVREVLR